MGRPVKRTMDFFIHEAGAMDSNEMQAVMLSHGSHGYAVYFMLKEMLCREQDHELCLRSTVIAKVVAKRTGCRDEAHLFKVIDSLCDVGLLERQHWEASRIVFSLGLYEWNMDRLRANEKEALRKQQTRKAKWYSDQIAANAHAHDPDPDLNSENRKQNADPDPDPDPDTEAEASKGTIQDNVRTTELSARTTRKDKQAGNETQAANRQFEQADRQATQYEKHPWRNSFNQLDKGFFEYCVTQMPTDREMHPRLMANGFINNGEREPAGHPKREKLEFWWQEYQDSAAAQTKPAPQPVAAAAMPKVGSADYNVQLRAMAAKRAGVELPPPTEKT